MSIQNQKNVRPVAKEITATDLTDYLDNEWDFAFELAVLNKLKGMGFKADFGGFYMDPITAKLRQFDIRAEIQTGIRSVRLAVECKNLKNTYPLLVTCVPRSRDEAFQDIIVSLDPQVFKFPPSISGQVFFPRSSFDCVRLNDFQSIYGVGKPIGKLLTQVERDQNGTFKCGDTDVYSKWTQALASAEELVQISRTDGERNSHGISFSAVVPVLVVPEGTLWYCEYDLEGKRTVAPANTDRVQVFFGRECKFDSASTRAEPYVLSHLEIVTPAGIDGLVSKMTNFKCIMADESALALLATLLKTATSPSPDTNTNDDDDDI